MIGDQFQPREVKLMFSEYDLAATTEAVHDALIKRVRWIVTREPNWARLDYEIAREAINQLTAVYGKVLFALRDLPSDALHPDFFDHFAISPEMWDLINRISLSSEWIDAPTHPHEPFDKRRPVCKLCDSFEMA